MKDLSAQLNARILLLERERDALRERNSRLRDELLDRANKCEACGGTGRVRSFEYIDPDDILKGCRQVTVPCEDCAAIRKVLE
jgi:hypothetical protein